MVPSGPRFDPPPPVVPSRAPSFGQVGRLPADGSASSRGLMMLIAVTVFAAFISLIWELQRTADRATIVEVTFMEEEAETAAELAGPEVLPVESEQAAVEQAAVEQVDER